MMRTGPAIVLTSKGVIELISASFDEDVTLHAASRASELARQRRATSRIAQGRDRLVHHAHQFWLRANRAKILRQDA